MCLMKNKIGRGGPPFFGMPEYWTMNCVKEMEAYAVFVNATEANMDHDVFVSASKEGIMRYLKEVESEICNDQDPEITVKQCRSIFPSLDAEQESGHLVCAQIPYTVWKKQIAGDVVYAMTFTGSDRETSLVCFTDDLSEIYKKARYYTHEYIVEQDMEEEIGQWVWDGEPTFTWMSCSPTYGRLTILRVGL